MHVAPITADTAWHDEDVPHWQRLAQLEAAVAALTRRITRLEGDGCQCPACGSSALSVASATAQAGLRGVFGFQDVQLRCEGCGCTCSSESDGSLAV